MTTPLRRLLPACCLLLLASLLPTLSSAADEAGEDAGRMVLVLDSSGSMKEPAGSGETKIAAAKRALGRVIGSLPDDQPVGLRVYGAEVFSRDDPGACQDSQLVVPVETGNRDQLRREVGRYRPYGETPTGYALQQAGQDLGGEGRRTIVLVSDGEPTCDPDPCEVARDLAEQGVDLTIDVVGLDVTGSAREQLQCVAGAGNGTYYDVDTSEELAASLEKLASRAARPYAEIGQAVTGTPTAEGAPTIGDGDWLDRLGTDEQELVRTYLVQRTIPGSTLHVSGSLRTASGNGEQVEVRLATPAGEDCGYGSDFTQLSAGQLISGGVTAGGPDDLGEVQPDDPCTAAESLVATVTNDAADATGPRPLEVRVVEEPPVADAASLPDPESMAADWVPPPGRGEARRTTGGSSFADAPTLAPGIYRDTVVPGEVLTYAVELDWGQTLSVVADFPQPGTTLGEAIGNGDVFARLDVAGPSRQEAETAGTQGAPTSQSFLFRSAAQLGAFAGPVAYRQRSASSGAGAALAGRYTVTLFVEPDPDDESYLIPFTLRLGVDGEPTGAPTYTEAEPSPSVTPSEEASPDTDPETESTAADDSSEDDGPGMALLLGGLAVVALLVGGGYLLLRRRSMSA